MAIYTGALTDKQKEMLEPLEKEIKGIMSRKEFLRRKRAFMHGMGFEESKETRAEIERLDERHTELSRNIAEIYNAQSEMVEHMKKAIEEVKIIDAYCAKYGFDVH